MAASDLEWLLLTLIEADGLPAPDEQEYPFARHLKRRYRSDFAYTAERILIECEGATFANGRHTRGAGYAADCSKYNLAALLGYRVLRFTRAMIESGEATRTLRQALTQQAAA